MRRIALVALFAVTLFAGSSRADSGGSCSTDSDCGGGVSCRSGKCATSGSTHKK